MSSEPLTPQRRAEIRANASCADDDLLDLLTAYEALLVASEAQRRRAAELETENESNSELQMFASEHITSRDKRIRELEAELERLRGRVVPPYSDAKPVSHGHYFWRMGLTSPAVPMWVTKSLRCNFGGGIIDVCAIPGQFAGPIPEPQE